MSPRYALVCRATGRVLARTDEPDDLPPDVAPHYELVRVTPDLAASIPLTAHETMRLVDAALARYDELPGPTSRRQRAETHRLMREVNTTLSGLS